MLRGRLARAASQYDFNEQGGADVGKVLIGQNSSLVWSPNQRGILPVWTYEGAEKARPGINFQHFQLPEKSTARWFMNKILGLLGKEEFIKEAGAHEGEKGSMDFLLEHQDVGEEPSPTSLCFSKKSMLTLGEEFLRRGYFREEPLSKMLDEATLVMEGNFQDDTCNFGNFKHQCP